MILRVDQVLKEMFPRPCPSFEISLWVNTNMERDQFLLMSEVSLIHHQQKKGANKFFTMQAHSVFVSSWKNGKKFYHLGIRYSLPPVFFFSKSVIVQILMWPQLLQILNGGNTTFPSLFTANMIVGAVSCCKKLVCFQIDHISTPNWRDRFCSQYHQHHYSSLNKEKSNCQEHPILTQQQSRSVGHSCHWKTRSWPGPVPSTIKAWPQTGNCQHKYNQLRKQALAC